MSNSKMCNDCWLSMQNCHDRSICCEMDEYDGDQCDWFEPMHIVHGHWVFNEKDHMFYCTNCKNGSVNNCYPYCHWCGAKMDEVTE